MTLLSQYLKNLRAMRGKVYIMMANTATVFTIIAIPNQPVSSPLNNPAMTASTSSVRVSVIAVAPTAMVTLRSCERPNFMIVG